MVSFPMLTDAEIVSRQIPVIRKIIEDETWLEGERRGCEVAPNDGAVRENVCRVVLQIGQQIRDSITRGSQTGEPGPESTTSY